MAWNAHISNTTASINDRACADDNAAGGAHRLHGLARRAAGCDDVFDNQHALARLQPETPSQRHCTRFSFGKHRARTQRSSCFVSDDYPADRRGDNRLDGLLVESGGELPPYELGMLGILKHARTLQITRAMEPGRKLKVPLQQGAGLLKHVKPFLLRQADPTSRPSFSLLAASPLH
jgi:hypothetical protein